MLYRWCTVPTITWYFTLYRWCTVRVYTYYSIDILVPKLYNPVVSLIWPISTSHLYHGFYSAWDTTALMLYVLPRAQVYTYSPRAVQIPYTVKTMIQLLHVQVHCMYEYRIWKPQEHWTVVYKCNKDATKLKDPRILKSCIFLHSTFLVLVIGTLRY